MVLDSRRGELKEQAERSWIVFYFILFNNTRNSSGDEIANVKVNFFTTTSSTTFTQCVRKLPNSVK